MPLRDLKTDLKSLKYGHDRPGGGNSGQPYYHVDINKADSGFNKFRLTNFDDGLVRGGIVGAANASIVDTLRIGKFLTDFPKGPLFIVKQIGLQLSNPKLEAKKGASNFNTAVGPTRTYNLGINTLAQVPVNAFGQHITRQGFVPRQDDNTLYFKVVQSNNNNGNNRLVQLTSILGNTNNINIDSYIGGPNSVYGIGKTFIRRRGDFININQDVTENDWAVKGAKEAGIAYRISGHEGGTKDGYTDASRRITNFTGVSDFSGSLFAPKTLFFNDKRSIQSVFVGRRDNTPLGLDDQNITTYNAFDKASIGAKTKVADVNRKVRSGSFSRLSSFSSSSFSSLRFNKDDNNIKDVPLGLNDIDKLKNYSGSTTWTPLNGEPRAVDIASITNQSSESISSYPGVESDENSILIGMYQSAVGSVKTYADLQKRIKYTTDGNRGGVDINGKTVDINKFNIYGDTSKFRNGNFTVLNPISNDNPVYYNGKKTVVVSKGSWNKVSREVRVGSGLQDQINLTPLFEGPTGTRDDSVIIGGKTHNINDLVKFRIQSLNYDNPNIGKWMIFRAYITQFSDSTDASWNEVKYTGRGDKFYVYDSFSRKVNIGFKVAALSAEEMKPMYQKLNYLMGNLMGSYENNLLHGSLVKMTIGNWFDGQDGILNSLSYTVPQDSPWEISISTVNGVEPLILPHVIEVSMTFTPIGSQTKGVNKISEKDSETSHIAQNINDVQYITKFSQIG